MFSHGTIEEGIWVV